MSRSGSAEPTSGRAARWALWLVAGVSAGFLLGFAAGLFGPREPLRLSDPMDRLPSQEA